jgi:hypothetical protein
MLGSSLVNGGSECCNNGGAKKRVARKPKAKRGGNSKDTVTEPESQKQNIIEGLYSDDSGDAQSGGARKKKGSKVVAKRAPTPYNKFVKAQFAILKKKFPDDKAPQIMKKIAIEWKKTK